MPLRPTPSTLLYFSFLNATNDAFLEVLLCGASQYSVFLEP
jgi:hypothetical protein